MQMTEEMQKRIEEAAYSYEVPRHFNCYGCCQSDSDYEKAFKAGAKFILEMPELREFLKRSINIVNNNISHFDDCASLYDEEDTCSCGLDIEEQWFDKALSKIKALGIVKEGEK